MTNINETQNINLEKINEETLNLIKLFDDSDKKIAVIKTNDECNLYSKEEIELMQDEIKQLHEYTNNVLKIKIPKLQEQLGKLEKHKDLLNNVDKLELTISKFWYKFFWKFKESIKDELAIKWKNEYLDCYEKQFFQKKKLENINLTLPTKLNIEEINNNETQNNKLEKTKVNSMNLSN